MKWQCHTTTTTTTTTTTVTATATATTTTTTTTTTSNSTPTSTSITSSTTTTTTATTTTTILDHRDCPGISIEYPKSCRRCNSTTSGLILSNWSPMDMFWLRNILTWARVLASPKFLPTDSDLCASRIRRTDCPRRKNYIIYYICYKCTWDDSAQTRILCFQGFFFF